MRKSLLGLGLLSIAVLAGSLLTSTFSSYNASISFPDITIGDSSIDKEEESNIKDGEVMIDIFKDLLSSTDSYVYKYFAGYNLFSGKYSTPKKQGSSIDSEGLIWSFLVKEEIKQAVENYPEFNYNDNCSFRIYLKTKGEAVADNEYNLFYSPSDLSSLSKNDTIPFVYRYCTSNIENPVVSIGTSVVKKGQSGTQKIISGDDYVVTKVLKDQW